jgi:putative transposase
MTHHVIQRGTNRSDIFRADTDFEALLIALLEASNKYELDIHSYTLMTNHFHLLATPRTARAMSEAMRSASVRYVRYFNRKYVRTGTLFESRYRSFLRKDELITPHHLYLSLGDSDGVRQQHWRKICGQDLTTEQLTDIRDASNRGGTLGRSDRDSTRVATALMKSI